VTLMLPPWCREPVGTLELLLFEADYLRPSRSRAYASPPTSPRRGARLATGLLGSALAGRVSHPLDDEQNFVKLPLALTPS
jgi:hypothetical protein